MTSKVVALQPQLMGRRNYSHGDIPEAFMHYNDLRASLGWPGYMFTVRWHLLRMYQREFALELGTNKMHVSRMETGQSPITPAMLRKVNKLVTRLSRHPALVESARRNNWGGWRKAT